jgi:nitroreductase
MELYEGITSRRSIARLAPDEPSRAVIERLLTAATWAPYHHCEEPWRFIVISGDARRALGEISAQTLRRDPAIPEKAFDQLVLKERERFLRAPVIVIVVALGAENPIDAEENYAACCAATQNILLAARNEGLSGYWRTGKIIREQKIRESLRIEEHERIVAMVSIGTPDKAVAVPPATRTSWQKKTEWCDADLPTE